MSKQLLHYCNKTVTNKRAVSKWQNKGLQVTRADCSHRRERIYVRIIIVVTDCQCCRLVRNTAFLDRIKFNQTYIANILLKNVLYEFFLSFFFLDENSRKDRAGFILYTVLCVLMKIRFQRRFSLEYSWN